ncbi:MAG: universal stress protein [Lapillicoccus sp.]
MVVGVDASSTSVPALRWAIREAAIRRVPIHLVSAWSTDYDIDSLGLAAAVVEQHCRSILDAARADIAAVEPGISVMTRAYIGPASRALVEASAGADIVVVGTRGLRPLPALLLGTTSLEVAAHATCPVVVVRESDGPHPDDGPVVVGVDGSALSGDAIAFAFAHASAHGLGLTVLHAFALEHGGQAVSPLTVEESNVRLSQEELALTSEAVAGWREKFPDVDIKTATVHSHPVAALVDASRTAGLVVVGTRGRGALSGALLGSVSHSVLRRSHCRVRCGASAAEPRRTAGAAARSLNATKQIPIIEGARQTQQHQPTPRRRRRRRCRSQ